MAPTLILTDNHQPSVLKESVISTQNLSILQDAFSAVVEDSDGTGHLAKIDGIKLAGKTGTAQTSSDLDETNAWFVGFAEHEGKEIAIAVVVEDSGSGSSYAVPVAEKIFDLYFK